MTILIKNISLLYGKDLTFIDHGFININNQGIILDVGSIDKYSFTDENKATQVFDGEGFLVIPGLINAHTHIADSIGKDISMDFKFEEQIHPGAEQHAVPEALHHHRLFQDLADRLFLFGGFRDSHGKRGGVNDGRP